MPGRKPYPQLVRLREIRAPDEQNDQLTQAQVREAARTAVTMEDFTAPLLSQQRLAQGSQGWTQPPMPATGGGTGPAPGGGYLPGVGQEIRGERLSGDKNGRNGAFRTSHYFYPQSLAVYFNSCRLDYGGANDYVCSESQGDGTGFDTVTFTGMASPRQRDTLTADYIRSA